MKKKLLLLTTFLISFIMFSSSVLAAQELTCTYEQKSEENDSLAKVYQKIITQDSNGNITYNYISQEGGFGGTYKTLPNPNANVDFEKSSAYDKDKNVLTRCPDCVTWKDNWNQPNNDKFHFKDKDENNECGSKYAKLEEEKFEIEKVATCEKIDAPTQDDIDNTIWLAKCDYVNDGDKATIYLNKDRYLLKADSDNISSCISHSELITEYEQRQELCPGAIYYLKEDDELSFYFEYSYAYSVKKMSLKNGTYYDENGNIREQKNENKNKVTIDTSVPSDCRELIGQELIDEINKIMNLIRIIVPVLLLVFGITDFFRATFANADDDVKKSRDRFIKRVVAAIIVFIVPYFVNLVLNLTNKVWSDINPETCIDLEQ